MSQLSDAGKDIHNDSGHPNTLYVGLSSTTPTPGGGNVTEPVGDGYAREAITLGASASGIRENTNAIQFAAAGGDWGTQTDSVYFTALTGGTFYAWDALSAPRNMVDGATMDFAIGDIDFAHT